MQSAARSTVSKRKRREEKRPSCDRCRSQKLKCDAYQDLSKPCSRCRRRDSECIVSTERIRKVPDASPFDRHGESYSLLSEAGTISHDLSMGLHLEQQAVIIATNSPANTGAQALDGILVNGSIIEACFQQYKDYYFPLLPTIMISDEPETILHESPLKFWAVVCIGSRRLTAAMSLYQQLKPAVLNLAMLSINLSPLKSFPLIEGLILICSWHLVPGQLIAGSISFILSGIAYHKAQQIGLESENTPARAKDKHSDYSSQKETSRLGTMLWAQTLLTYQTSRLCSGRTFESSMANSFWNDALTSNYVPKSTALQGKMLSILMDTAKVVNELGLDKEENVQYEALKRVLSVIESQITTIKDRFEIIQGSREDFYIQTALLHLHVFVFHAKPEDQSLLDLIKLYQTATTVLDTAKILDDVQDFALYFPYNILHSILLAATAIRRLTAIDEAHEVFETANNYLEISMDLCNRASVVASDDLAHECRDIISQLWSSPQLYKCHNGSPKLGLQIRNRLSASILYDAIFRKGQLMDYPAYIEQLVHEELNALARQMVYGF